MNKRTSILSITQYIGLTLLSIGLIIFSIGFFGSDYSILTPIGIGTIVASVFIFLIGAFFVATEEMLFKTQRGIRSLPEQNK